jgi:hypothetical protein
MGKVYRHKPGAPDEYLGRVEPENGKVYHHRHGPDERLGHTELDSGRIYRRRLGPDEYLGRVHLDDGKVYSHRIGPDPYVAEVKSDGRIYRHKPGALDDYLGRVEGMHSLAEGGAAYFLLLLPIVEGAEIVKVVDEAEDSDADQGRVTD